MTALLTEQVYIYREYVYCIIYLYCVYSFGKNYANVEELGPVVQSIVSLTSSLIGQLGKYFTTL